MFLRSHHRSASRRGVVLLAVLIVVVLLSLAAYKYNEWMVAEFRATDSSIRAAQARAFANSGIAYTAALLAGKIDQTLNDNPWDNPSMFQGIAVPSTGKSSRTGRFFVLSLRPPDELGEGGQAHRFGAVDEAGKINVNALLALDGGRGNAGYKVLMALPNMTEEIANAILDWIDPDETPRTNGAENDYYGTLPTPYLCKNGPLDTLEELLLVRGVNAGLLFGNDHNRNGVLDPEEDDGSGTIDLGWSAFLTVYSREVNVDSEGAPRININDRDVNALAEKLTPAIGQDLANYIIAYRMYGGTSVDTSGGRRAPTTMAAGSRNTIQGQMRTDRSNTQNRKMTNIGSLWDLVNSTVNVPQGNTTVSFPSPLNDPGQQKQLLPLLLDKCSTSTSTDLTPRININTAPQTVLMALKEVGGLSDADVQSIVGRRPAPSSTSAPDPIYKTPAWLYTELNLPMQTVKKLDPFVTARTQVYRFQVVGQFDNGGPMARLEAVVDANQGRPRIVYWRDLSELGKGFDVSGGQ